MFARPGGCDDCLLPVFFFSRPLQGGPAPLKADLTTSELLLESELQQDSVFMLGASLRDLSWDLCQHLTAPRLWFAALLA